MRKYIKNQCTELLNSLAQAHEELENLMKKKNMDEVSFLLEQCQQGAIEVGNRIEEIEGEGTQAVHLLEEYCERLYQIHDGTSKGVWSNAMQINKKSVKLLARANHSIQDDLDTQTEAVFLPYKASMWDSLESVWRAADEDADCHAVVIPIPYYDKNSDGTLGEMHYEGDLFPEDVPVVNYDAYDFENIHPDMIFIHNPYDEGNRVTSVHPFFYSKNLKQYTDKLVYIPYFVLNEVDPSNKEAVKSVEKFCVTSAVIHADYVIVQSEAMRQIYVDVLTEQVGENSREYWEKKILGMGSPKVDRVCNPKKEDLELPKEWERIILKADGSRKKVIFYNTSISALLAEKEKMLDKMEENFGIFKENREEVALLWRPHPLIEATLVSMRPQLLERYNNIVKKYKMEGWGIYDDSPEMYRAIAISDAYYGDWSSVVWLYEKTGKPIMIQNCEL